MRAKALMVLLFSMLPAWAKPPAPSSLVASTSVLSTSVPSVSVPLFSARPLHADALGWEFEAAVARPTPVVLTCQEDGGSHELHRLNRTITATQSLQIHGLKPDTVYGCELIEAEAPHTRLGVTRIHTDPLPSTLKVPIVTVRSSDLASTGYTLFTYCYLTGDWHYQNRYIIIMDAEGIVRWYYPDVGGGDVDVTYLGDDRVLFDGWGEVPERPTIVDLNKQIVWEGTETPASATEIPSGWNHDAGISSDGKSVFALTNTQVAGAAGQQWRAFVIKQIDIATNKVIWSWDAISHGLDPRHESSSSANRVEPYHANALWDQVENGRLYVYVSLKNQNRILKIDTQTGQMVWSLGPGWDFKLLESNGSAATMTRWFFDQHDFKRIGNRVFVHDNGSDRSKYAGGTQFSRALELELDETKKTARIVWEYTEPSWFEPSWGGVDLLSDGNRLLAIGHSWPVQVPMSARHVSSLVELNSASSVVWRADYDFLEAALYRAERIDGCAIFDNTTYCP